MTSCWFSSKLSRSERGRIVVVHRRDGACCGFAVSGLRWLVGGGFSGTSWWFRRGRGFTAVIALLGFLRLAVLVVTVVSAAVAALGGDDVMCLLLMGETEREMRTEGQCGKRRNKIKIPSIKKKKTMYLMVKKQFGII